MKTVAVIGSGASGLAAALAAANGGAKVTVFEREPKFGGTTALSGGNAWLPGHAGLPDDSAELGLTYLRELSLGDADDELLQVFAREAGPTAARVERETAMRLQAIPYCDYHAEFAGLSACKTATGGAELLDEAITLAAALHYTGYRHVIGTLWSVHDSPGTADLFATIYRDMAVNGRVRPERSATTSLRSPTRRTGCASRHVFKKAKDA